MNATLPAPAPTLPTQALHGQTMGTTWSVRFHARARIDLHALHDAVQARPPRFGRVVLFHAVAREARGTRGDQR